MGVLRDWTKSVLPTFRKLENEYFRVGQNSLLKKDSHFLSNCPKILYQKFSNILQSQSKYLFNVKVITPYYKVKKWVFTTNEDIWFKLHRNALTQAFFSQMKWQSAIKLHYSNCYFTWGNEGWLGNSSLHLWRHKN